jgi:hypothetical protein
MTSFLIIDDHPLFRDALDSVKIFASGLESQKLIEDLTDHVQHCVKPTMPPKERDSSFRRE